MGTDHPPPDDGACLSLRSRLEPLARRGARYIRRMLPVGGIPVGRALKTGLFDLGYYVAQTDIDFPSARYAARHYLKKGAALGLLPHPLIDASIAHDEERALSLGRALARGRVASARFATAYDWDAYVIAEPRARRHRGGPAGHFALSRPQSGGSELFHLDGSPADFSASSRRILRRNRRWAATIADSGLFDARYYGVQVGSEFASTRAAVWHYVCYGEPTGLSPAPLFEPEWYDVRRKSTRGSAFADYLTTNRDGVSPHPQFDPNAYRATVAKSRKHPSGVLGHFLEHATENTTTFPFDDYAPRRNWFTLRGELYAAARLYADSEKLRAWGSLRPWSRRVEGRYARTLRARSGDVHAEVAVVFDLARVGPDLPTTLAALRAQRRIGLQIIAVGSADEHTELPESVAFVVCESVNHADRINTGLASTSAVYVHVWNPRVLLTPTFLADSVQALRRAGAEFAYSAASPGGDFCAVAWGAPYSREGLIWGDPTAVAATGVLTTRLFRELGGLDPAVAGAAEWDLALRASRERDLLWVPLLQARVRASAPSAAADPAAEHIARAGALVDWDAAASVERLPHRVSLLVPVYQDWQLTVDMARAVLDTTIGRDIEIVLVDNGSRRAVGGLISAALAYQPRVSYRRMPRNTNFSTGTNLALLASTGATVAFVNNDTEPKPGWLDPLLSSLEHDDVRAVQPLLLYPDGTVQAAGTVLMGNALPWHFLQSHPVEDAIRADQREFSALTAAFMALRADEAIAVRGFDPAYVNGMEDVDLCLRMTERFGGGFRVALESVVIHKESQAPGRLDRTAPNRILFTERWATRMPNADLDKYTAAGFRYVGYRTIRAHKSRLFRSGAVQLERPPRIVAEGEAAGLPALRWAIKTAAHSDARGDGWGDTFFAADLARALRELGQEVVVDRRLSHVRPDSDYLDDVIVGLRGLEQIVPQPGATSVLWVISHPELVSTRELVSGFDLVYAASERWAQLATDDSGQLVRPLLQATDPARFHPGAVDPALASDTLFVGRTRNVFRPIIRDAIEVGADLAIYGDGWGRFIDERYVRAEHLDNAQLSEAYRSARVVLNDHWSDMAALGFASNRLFDAAASGAVVVTDPVAGLGDLFGALVREYSGVEELRALLDPGYAGWPGAAERAELALAIGREHSFLARARTMLADVLDTRGIEHGLR